jgi:very-short-patch-repair endonuclease
MELRTITFVVLRYSDEQVLDDGAAVIQEVGTVYAERDAHL